MNKLSRDSWLAIGLFALLLIVTVAASVQQLREQSQADTAALSSVSSTPDGARALWLWLEELGYSPSNQVGAVFAVPVNSHLVFMLEPQQEVTAEEWRILDAWVEAGGTLVLTGSGWGMRLALDHYDADLAYLGDTAMTATLQTPLFASPPITVPIAVQTRVYLESGRDDYVVHLATDSHPVLLSFEQGAGRVVLSSTPFSFSNAGLKRPGNPELILNMVAAAGEAGQVWFDEWHHGVRMERGEMAGPQDWLRYTPAGRSLLYAAGVILIALLLQGRRFGRPVPLTRQVIRRAPLEYVTAIANLSRRAGHRQAVLRHYHHLLKRDLGRRYRLSPALPDDEYVAQLSQFDPNLDQHALRQLLGRLQHGDVSEGEMIQLAGEAAQWLKES